MQFIQSIILIVVTTIVTNLFTRKFYISDKDRIIKEKQFKIYEGLYINIVKNRVNEPILSCLAKKKYISSHQCSYYKREFIQLSKPSLIRTVNIIKRSKNQ